MVSAMEKTNRHHSFADHEFAGMLHEQSGHAHSKDELDEAENETETSWSLHSTSAPEPSSRLKHSPRYENLAVYSRHSEDDSSNTATKHPCTPPPSPTPRQFSHDMAPIGSLAFALDEEESAEARQEKQRELDRLYEILASHRPLPDRVEGLQEGVAVLEASAEIGVTDIIKQV